MTGSLVLLTTDTQQGKELNWQQSSLFVFPEEAQAWGPAGKSLSIAAESCSSGKGFEVC